MSTWCLDDYLQKTGNPREIQPYFLGHLGIFQWLQWMVMISIILYPWNSGGCITRAAATATMPRYHDLFWCFLVTHRVIPYIGILKIHYSTWKELYMLLYYCTLMYFVSPNNNCPVVTHDLDPHCLQLLHHHHQHHHHNHHHKVNVRTAPKQSSLPGQLHFLTFTVSSSLCLAKPSQKCLGNMQLCHERGNTKRKMSWLRTCHQCENKKRMISWW